MSLENHINLLISTVQDLVKSQQVLTSQVKMLQTQRPMVRLNKPEEQPSVSLPEVVVTPPADTTPTSVPAWLKNNDFPAKYLGDIKAWLKANKAEVAELKTCGAITYELFTPQTVEKAFKAVVDNRMSQASVWMRHNVKIPAVKNRMLEALAAIPPHDAKNKAYKESLLWGLLTEMRNQWELKMHEPITINRFVAEHNSGESIRQILYRKVKNLNISPIKIDGSKTFYSRKDLYTLVESTRKKVK